MSMKRDYGSRNRRLWRVFNPLLGSEWVTPGPKKHEIFTANLDLAVLISCYWKMGWVVAVHVPFSFCPWTVYCPLVCSSQKFPKMCLILQAEIIIVNYLYRNDNEFCSAMYIHFPSSPWQMFLRWPDGLGVCIHKTAFLCAETVSSCEDQNRWRSTRYKPSSWFEPWHSP